MRYLDAAIQRNVSVFFFSLLVRSLFQFSILVSGKNKQGNFFVFSFFSCQRVNMYQNILIDWSLDQRKL